MTALTKSKPAPEPASAGTAYGDDFYTWTQEQGASLRTGQLDALDRENLVEDIDSLGRSQFDALISASRAVFPHMLKFDHQPARRTRGWAILIATHREIVADELEDSPALKSRLGEAVERAYRRARLEASKETGLKLKRFPETCPYTLDEITTRPFAIDEDDRIV